MLILAVSSRREYFRNIRFNVKQMFIKQIKDLNLDYNLEIETPD